LEKKLKMDFDFNFGCCENEDRAIRGIDTDDAYNSLLSESDIGDSFDNQASTFQSDYNVDCTPMFKAIESEDWKSLLIFLTTGKWGSSVMPFSSHMEDRPASDQARTWMICRAKNGNVEWRQLPLHAAISYRAPLPIIQKLVELYYDGLRSADDDGNLPLHLAFGFGSPDNVVAYLVREFPGALSARGLQARFPLDCSDLGTNTSRAEIIRAYQKHTRACMIKDWNRSWRQSLAATMKKAGVSEPSVNSTQTLQDVFNELVETKLELEKQKELVKKRPTMIITKTEASPTGFPPRSPGLLKSTGSATTTKRFTFSGAGNKICRTGSRVKSILTSPLQRSSSRSIAPSPSDFNTSRPLAEI